MNGVWIRCRPEIDADFAITCPVQSWLLPVLTTSVCGASSVPFQLMLPVTVNVVTPTRFHGIPDALIPLRSIASIETLSGPDGALRTLTTSVDPAGAAIWNRGARASTAASMLSTLTVCPVAPCSCSAYGCSV